MHNLDHTLLEFGEEAQTGYEAESGEYSNEYASEYGSGELAEAEEVALASELLSISSEEELDHFLGNLIRKAGQAAGKFIKGPAGKALGGILKGVAKTALPAVANIVAPGIGGQLASMATDAFGLETEGLSNEEQEWEAAKSFVRLADRAAKNLSETSPAVPPPAAAKSAVVEAAKQHAPGLLRDHRGGGNGAGRGACSHAQSGRWVRRGNTIVILGA